MDSSLCVPLCACRHGWGGACVNVHVNLLGKWTRLCVCRCVLGKWTRPLQGRLAGCAKFINT